jgi:ribosomal protein S18 acetylase RimI-like enzyme
MNNKITYLTGDETLIDHIEELWTELNQVHFEKSLDFKHHYKNLTFCKRKKLLLSRIDEGELFITIACDGGRKIGYCIASLAGNAGEIDSIYVKPDYRKLHIGSTLLEKSLDWFNSLNATTATIKVAVGNEEAFDFYSRYGFEPIFTELQIATKLSY